MKTVEDILQALREVMDPEIPTVSLVDLGVITSVTIDDDGVPHVEMTPTFAGCPAMDYMQNQVREKLAELGFEKYDVEMNMRIPWSSNRVTEEGIEGLKKHGLAPPEKYEGALELTVLNDIPCPNCGSRETTLKSPFGPTLCRSLHYCRNCGEAFEAFKPL